jgi:hypothetical protein
MTAEIFTGIDALRLVLETETDKDSPDNETTYGAIRKAVECLFLILLGTGVDGTVTAIAETVLTDTGNFVASAHLEHTLVMTSGAAKGHAYTIDSNTVDALTCTGDTMVSDGVQIGDSYVILHDLKTSVGHTHNAKDAPNVTLADGGIATAKYADNSVTLEKIEHYTVQALPSDCEEGTLHTTVANGYVTKRTYKYYVPTNATTLAAIFNAKVTAGSTSNVRFSVGGNPSSVFNVQNTSFAWTDAMELDISGLSGWVDLEVELDGDGSATLSVQGYQFLFV